MKRLFWFGLGVAAGVVASRKVRQTTQQVTPAGLAGNLGDAVRELGSAVGSFGAEVRAGMQEREQELHDMVEYRKDMSRPNSFLEANGRHAATASRPVRARRAGN